MSPQLINRTAFFGNVLTFKNIHNLGVRVRNKNISP